MKTERRHELQTNVLADWLGRKIQHVKPYSKTILAVLIGILAVIGFWQYWSSQNVAQLAEGWRSYFESHNQALMNQDPEPLQEIAKTQGGTQAGLWALKAAADLELANGNRSLFRDRDQAKEALEAAQKIYEDLVKRAGRNKMLKTRVQFGLGQAYESLGELDKARENYQAVVSQSDEPPISSAAQSRLDQLKSPDTKKFYAWFDKQDPDLAFRMPDMSSQRHSMLPQDLGALSDRPDLSFPGSPGLDLPLPDDKAADNPDTDKPTTDENKATTQAGGTDKPATDKPATDKPATDKPATDKPATDKPATDKPATDKPATDKPATDKPATDKPATDTPDSGTPALDAPTLDAPAKGDNSAPGTPPPANDAPAKPAGAEPGETTP